MSSMYLLCVCACFCVLVCSRESQRSQGMDCLMKACFLVVVEGVVRVGLLQGF